MIEVPRIITNGFVTIHPELIFLYAYDVMGKSVFGQPQILGHKNTFPVPTMYKFCNSGARYFTDSDTVCRGIIDNALANVPRDGRPIIPLRKMGEGCSRLKELAPLTHKYLYEQLDKIRCREVKWHYDW